MSASIDCSKSSNCISHPSDTARRVPTLPPNIRSLRIFCPPSFHFFARVLRETAWYRCVEIGLCFLRKFDWQKEMLVKGQSGGRSASCALPLTSHSCCCADCSRLNYAKMQCGGSFWLANLLRGIMIMPNFAIGLIGRYPLARVSSVSIIYNVYGCCNGDSRMAEEGCQCRLYPMLQ